jgi:hypothetical protein
MTRALEPKRSHMAIYLRGSPRLVQELLDMGSMFSCGYME